MKKSNILMIFFVFLASVVFIPETIFAEKGAKKITLSAENAYMAGLCEEGEKPSGDLVIPDTFEYKGKKYIVTVIDDFQGCEISSLLLPDTVKTINAHAFQDCKKLRSVNMGNGVTYIGFRAFAYCKKLEEVVFSNQYKETGFADDGDAVLWHIFIDDKNLSHLVVGEKMTDLRPFRSHPKLKTVGPYGGNYNIEYRWKDEIPDSAFAVMKNIQEVTISKTIKTIGDRAFINTSSLKKLRIGKNVEEIKECAFFNDSNVVDVVIKSKKLKTNRVGKDAFYNWSSKAVIKVPKNKGREYKEFFIRTGASNSAHFCEPK